MIGFLTSTFLKKNLTNIIKTGLVILLVAVAFFYYNWSQKEIATLKTNTVLLEKSNEQQQNAIESLTKGVEQLKNSYNNLNEKSLEYQKEIAELKNVFNKDGRDFTELSKKKPQLIENIINKGTEKEFKCLESISKNEKCE